MNRNAVTAPIPHTIPHSAATLVKPEDEIMLITTGGVLIRTRVSEVREQGRSTQGVRLINLDDGEKLAGLEKIVEPDEDEEETLIH